MIKIAGTVVILSAFAFTYLLCRASSMSRDWEAEDEEQARFLSEYAEKGK